MEPEYQKPLEGAPPLGDLTVRMRFGIAVSTTVPVVPLLVLVFAQLLILEFIHWLLP